MSKTQKRIKIAEFIGFRDINPKTWRGTICGRAVNIPDYFGDLNSSHKAEGVIPFSLWPKYRENIRRIVLKDTKTFTPQMAYIDIHAEAHQKAEAFGRTFKLWS